MYLIQTEDTMLSKDTLKSLTRSLGKDLLIHSFYDGLGVQKHRDARNALVNVSCQAIAVVIISSLVDSITDGLGDVARSVIFGAMVLYLAIRLAFTIRRKMVQV